MCGKSAQSRSKTGVSRERDGVARARRRAAPAVEDDERYEREAGCPANRREGVGVEGGAADERAVDVGLGEQLGGVLRLDRAAVEDARRRGAT